MADKPTLVFVPGAWHTADTWNKVSSLLTALQYECILVTLPSTAGNALTTFEEDIKAVRDPIIAETTKGRHVVLVVHSYGGMVGESAIKGLSRPEQSAPLSTGDSSGYIIGLIVIASGFTMTGVGFIDGFGGKPPPSWRLDPSGFAVIVDAPRELFYHDLSKEEGDYWVTKLKRQALRVMVEGGEHAYAGWLDVPVQVLATTEDKAFPIQAQRMLVQGAKDAGADITVREIMSSHSPMLSKPQETANFILEAVVTFMKSDV